MIKHNLFIIIILLSINSCTYFKKVDNEIITYETYEYEGYEVSIKKMNSDCTALLIDVTDNKQDSTTTYETWHRKYLYKEKKSNTFGASSLSSHAVTSINENYYYFDRKLDKSIQFIAVESVERTILKNAIIKCNCEEKLGVDYDKIIGWVY